MSSGSRHHAKKVLQRVKDAYGLETHADLARFLDVGRSTPYTWIKRDSLDFDVLFSKCEDLSYDWLLRGEGPQRIDDIPSPSAAQIKKSVVTVPMLGTYFGAGPGGSDDEHLNGLLLAGDYLRDWMRQEAGVDPQKAFLGEVRGRSMEEWASDGDLVIGERVETITYQDIYAVDLEGEFLIKHCIRRSDAIILRSENRVYEDIEVTASNDFRVIGRVARRIVA